MDANRIDLLARRLHSRRTALRDVLVGSLAAALGLPGAGEAMAVPRCRPGKKRCRKRCIPKRKCCTNANCRPKGSGKICRRGRCRCPRGTRLCGRRCLRAGVSCPSAEYPPCLLLLGGACWPDAEELSFVALINNYRATNGVPPLALHPQLGIAAELHSQDMAIHDFFDHTGSDGSEPEDRIARAGYAFSDLAENIFSGSPTASAAFIAWRNSQGHDVHMLNPAFTDFGIGRASSAAGVWYWTTTFGRPR